MANEYLGLEQLLSNRFKCKALSRFHSRSELLISCPESEMRSTEERYRGLVQVYVSLSNLSKEIGGEDNDDEEEKVSEKDESISTTFVSGQRYKAVFLPLVKNGTYSSISGGLLDYIKTNFGNMGFPIAKVGLDNLSSNHTRPWVPGVFFSVPGAKDQIEEFNRADLVVGKLADYFLPYCNVIKK